MEATPVATAPIEKKRWQCGIHFIMCSIGHPCYECKREQADPQIIESQYRSDVYAKEREKNSHPRLRI